MGTVFRLCLKEVVNKRVIYLGLALMAVYLLLFGMGMSSIAKGFSQAPPPADIFRRELGYQLLTMGLYFSSILAGVLAIFAGTASISGEMESGTILGLASKPVSRTRIILGKFLAYGLITSLCSGLLVVAVFLIADYHLNLFALGLPIVKSVGFFLLLPLTLLAPTILGSTILSSLGNGVLMFMLFSMCIIGGFVEQIGAMMNNANMINAGIIVSLIMPSDTVYRLAVAQAGSLVGPGIISNFGPFGSLSAPSSWSLVYAVFYVLAMLGLATYVFGRRDL